MSRDAAVSDENSPSDKETYHYFAMLIAVLLLAWLFLTIYRGGMIL